MIEVKKGKLTFQQEPWSIFFEDAKHLFSEHKDDVGNSDFEMEIDPTSYQDLERVGQLFILTARRAGGIIGYVVVKVCKHPHYRFLAGFEDAYFLAKHERGSKVGVELIKESLRLLKDRGVKKVFFHSKTLKAHREMFTSLDFVHSDEIWARTL